jgi:hypothetical protein
MHPQNVRVQQQYTKSFSRPIILNTNSPHFSEVKVWNIIHLIFDLIYEHEVLYEKYQKGIICRCEHR